MSLAQPPSPSHSRSHRSHRDHHAHPPQSFEPVLSDKLCSNPSAMPSQSLHSIDVVLDALQRTQDRYMDHPDVSRWLLARDAHSDFHAIRQETSVLVLTAPTAPPILNPATSANLSFPVSDELHFLDSMAGPFALGHVCI